MGTYRKIMIVVDKEMKHGAAFARGVEFAKKTGAEVLLMLADYRGALIRAHSLDKDVGIEIRRLRSPICST